MQDIVFDLIYVENFNDDYNSCWCKALYQDTLGVPNKGVIVGTPKKEVRWEPSCMTFGAGGRQTHNRSKDHNLVYSCVFVGGDNCELQLENDTVLDANKLLVSQTPISKNVQTSEFEIEWTLLGCEGLPHFEIFIQELADPARDFFESGKSERLQALGREIYPEQGASLGFHTKEQFGVIRFKKRLDNSRYIVEATTVNFGDETDISGELQTTYSAKINNQVISKTNSFGRVLLKDGI